MKKILGTFIGLLLIGYGSLASASAEFSSPVAGAISLAEASPPLCCAMVPHPDWCNRCPKSSS